MSRFLDQGKKRMTWSGWEAGDASICGTLQSLRVVAKGGAMCASYGHQLSRF